MSFVVLDTDVASASLRGRLADPLRIRLTGQTWRITFDTVGELIDAAGPQEQHPVQHAWPARFQQADTC